MIKFSVPKCITIKTPLSQLKPQKVDTTKIKKNKKLQYFNDKTSAVAFLLATVEQNIEKAVTKDIQQYFIHLRRQIKAKTINNNIKQPQKSTKYKPGKRNEQLARPKKTPVIPFISDIFKLCGAIILTAASILLLLQYYIFSGLCVVMFIITWILEHKK